MRVGIGVTTYKRPEMLEKCLASIEKYTKGGYKLHVAIDTDRDRKGVAYRKNECLRALKDCDHVFLFDDDCYPIKEGWEDLFINSGQEHLLFLNNGLHNLYGKLNSVHIYENCGGVFMYMTKAVIERVGAFNEDFKTWGFEHAEYSIRILGEHGIYPMLVGTEQYLYSEDYSNPLHKSSITNEEKQLLFDKNFPIFRQPIKNIYLPL